MRRRNTVFVCAAAVILATALIVPSLACAAEFTRVFRLPDPVWDFTDPQDAVRKADGTIWLVDLSRCRLVHLASDGHELMSVGGPGTTDGLFTGPRNVALGEDGLVYVIDGSGRLQRFRQDGTFVSSVVVNNPSPYYLASLSGLCVDSHGSVFVSDAWTGAVQKLREDGSAEQAYTGASAADDVVVDTTGTVYVSDSRNGDIVVFEPDGALARRMPVERVSGPNQRISGLALAPDGTLLVAVSGAVVRMSTSGEYVGTVASDPITIPTALPTPGGLSVDSNGVMLWTASRWRLDILDFDGTLLGSHRAPDGPGPFSAPSSFAFFGDTTFVTDGQPLLHRLGPDGSVRPSLPLPDAYPYNPKRSTVAVDASGAAYVTDTELDSVWRFTPDGEFAGSFFSEWGIGPGIVIGPDGALYVTHIGGLTYRFPSGESTPSATWRSISDTVVNYAMDQPIAMTPEGELLTGQQYTYQSDAAVRRFSTDGTHVSDFGTFGSGPGQFNWIASIAVDAGGRIFVADQRNNRVEWFGPDGTFWGMFGGTSDTPFGAVRAVGFDPQGRLWVGYGDTVAVFEVSGLAPPVIEVTPVQPALDQSLTVDIDSTPGQNNVVIVQTSSDGVDWETTMTVTAPDDGHVQFSGLRIQESMNVRALERSSRGDRVTSYSAHVKRVPSALLTTPSTLSLAERGVAFGVSGSIRPAYASGGYPVEFRTWRWESGAWKSYGSVAGKSTASSGSSRVAARLNLAQSGRWRIRAFHPDDSRSAAAWSSGYAYVTVKSRPSVGTPKAPRLARTGVAFRVYGYLTPMHAKGSHPVRLYAWHKTKSGTWKSYGWVKAKAADDSGRTVYSAKMKLKSPGSWRVRAYAPADASHFGHWSHRYDYITVR